MINYIILGKVYHYFNDCEEKLSIYFINAKLSSIFDGYAPKEYQTNQYSLGKYPHHSTLEMHSEWSPFAPLNRKFWGEMDNQYNN